MERLLGEGNNTSLTSVFNRENGFRKTRAPCNQIEIERNENCASTRLPWRKSLNLVEKGVSFTRRRLVPKESVYDDGRALESLYVIYAGSFKIECLTSDGRVRSAEVLLDGEWLGFDAIPTGYHTCTATALDFGEVWVINYKELIRECAKNTPLLTHVITAISKSLMRSRDQMLSMGSLSSYGKVADFLVRWTSDLSEHGRRTDVITVPLTRAEIGSCLGVRIETVSRALKRLAQIELIQFDEKNRREISIRDVNGLRAYVQESADMNQSSKDA